MIENIYSHININKPPEDFKNLYDIKRPENQHLQPENSKLQVHNKYNDSERLQYLQPENSKLKINNNYNDSERLQNFEPYEKELNTLTNDEKIKLKEETGWSNEIIEAIGSLKEAEIYKNAGLHEEKINGKICLIKDINMEQKDEFGRTNKQRMENGQAPLTKNNEVVELHHIGQKPDSPLAELAMQEHRGKGNDTILHDKQKVSEIDRIAFGKERADHWQSRSNC